MSYKVLLAGLALFMLTLPTAAQEHSFTMGDLVCGNKFMTVPVETGPDASELLTVRKSNVVEIIARGDIGFAEYGNPSTLEMIMLNVRRTNNLASRTVRYELDGKLYPFIVQCLN